MVALRQLQDHRRPYAGTTFISGFLPFSSYGMNTILEVINKKKQEQQAKRDPDKHFGQLLKYSFSGQTCF